MNYNQQIEKDIQEIMDEFNWERVHKTMLFLNWQWWDTGVPTTEQLKKRARTFLGEAINSVLTSDKKKYKYLTGTGGLVAEARRYKDEDKIYIKLEFILTSWENY